jgi:predicted MFS family arabinose efflux permease
MAVGVVLSLWRRSGKFVFQGSDALLLAALLSFGMALFCATCVPHTPPSGGANWAAVWDPLVAMLRNRNVLIFLGISLVATTQLQFYYMGTAPFLEAIGCRHANVPAIMTVAQIAEVAATAWVAPFVLRWIGYQWTLALGPLLWAAMYAAYTIQRPRWLVVTSMALHGFAFAFFLDTGGIFINQVAPPAIRGTAQSLYVVVTLGLGLFLGSRFTGTVLDRCRTAGGHRWRVVFATPCITLALCALAFAAYFTDL